MERRIIEKMVKAMGFTNEDVILLNFWGTEDRQDLEDFIEVMSKANIVFKVLDLSDSAVLQLMKENPTGLSENWFDQYKGTTAVVDLMDKQPGMPPADLPREKVPEYGKLLKSLFGFMATKEKFIQVTMPTKVNAMLAGVDFDVYKKQMTEALDVDYDKLKSDCTKKLEAFSGDKRVIKTGKDCVLTLETTGREWFIDAGEGAFPCGEVYIAPLETKSYGTIFFKNFVVNDESYENVTLTFEEGRMVASDCEAFNEFIKSIPEDNANVLAELGIGMNPSVLGNSGVSELDEDALGTFHIALGMNNMFGGENACRFHMDFVTTGEII